MLEREDVNFVCLLLGRQRFIEDDILLADLLITDKAAIESVRAGLREVSCGYDADYEQIEPGRGRQRNIIGNHVALVEKGRCGSRCAIGDKDMPTQAKKKTRWTDFKSRMTAAPSPMDRFGRRGSAGNGGH